MRPRGHAESRSEVIVMIITIIIIIMVCYDDIDVHVGQSVVDEEEEVIKSST